MDRVTTTVESHPGAGRSDGGRSSRAAPGRGAAALSGVLAAAVALATGELLAAALPDARSPVVAVGDAVIDTVPGWLERWAIGLLGQADKPALVLGIVVLCGALGAVMGVAAVRRFGVAVAGFAAAGAVGLLAVAAASEGSLTSSALALAGALAAGLAALAVLLRAAAQPSPDRAAAPARTAARSGGAGAVTGAGWGTRRTFLQTALALGALAALGGWGAQMLGTRRRVAGTRAAVDLPVPRAAAPAAPPGASFDIPGLTPLYVPNADFYRIDTALRVPQVDPAGWSLRVEGMVQRPFTLTYAELLAMPQLEADITLACVSNEVGGSLVGNARWLGVPLQDLLERAGVDPGATQLVGRSVDGFTAGFPAAIAQSRREAMVALAMNGEPLPIEHGFPARLVVPGLYGYVSATKWLSSIELTTFEAHQGYWIPRGWAREGPIKTQSRIDVPARSSRIVAGRTPIAGVAWAPTRGITRVEVRIDDGPWTDAQLAAELDVDSWRQWMLPWDATPGRHTITVRATDGSGHTQSEQRTPVAPDGAEGHHSITVDVQPAV